MYLPDQVACSVPGRGGKRAEGFVCLTVEGGLIDGSYSWYVHGFIWEWEGGVGVAALAERGFSSYAFTTFLHLLLGVT